VPIAEIEQIAQLVNTGGVVGVLVLAVVVLAYGSFREWWIPGPTHRRLLEEVRSAGQRELDNEREEKKAWRTIALGLGNTAERSVVIAEQQLGIQLGPPGSH